MKTRIAFVLIAAFCAFVLFAELLPSHAALLIKGRRETDYLKLVDTTGPSESTMWSVGVSQYASGLAVKSDDGENGILYVAAENSLAHFDLATSASLALPVPATGYTFLWGLEYIESGGEGKLFSVARNTTDQKAYLIEFNLGIDGIAIDVKGATPIRETNGQHGAGPYAGLAWHSGKNTLYTLFQANVLQPLGFDGQLGEGEATLYGNGCWGLAYQDGELYGTAPENHTLMRFDLDQPELIDRVVYLADYPDIFSGNALTGTTTPPPPLTPFITTGSLPDGDVDIPYEEPVEAIGGTRPYSWTITAGSLPPGLSIGWTTVVHDHNIVITGTPMTEGLYTFTIRVTDDDSNYDEKQFGITIRSFKITTESLPPAYQDTPYSVTLEQEGGAPPLLWTGQIGTLPAGLSINDSTGEISGIPTTIESQTFTIRVTDLLAKLAEKEFTIDVLELPPQVFLYGMGIDPNKCFAINATNEELFSETFLFTITRATGAAYDSENGELYLSAAWETNQLSKWDPSTGSMLWSNTTYQIRSGATRYDNCHGLEFLDGTLYGIGVRDNDAYLLTIDVDTNIGEAAEVGLIGAGLGWITGLAFVPETGFFYMCDDAWTLYKIDPNSVGPEIGTPMISMNTKYHGYGLAYVNSEIGTGEQGKLMGLDADGSVYRIDWVTGDRDDRIGIADDCSHGLTGQTSPNPMAIPPQELPNVSRQNPYSAQIGRNGGTGPFTWSITDGVLPSGLTLNSSVP